jgi:hypothetical protein
MAFRCAGVFLVMTSCGCAPTENNQPWRNQLDRGDVIRLGSSVDAPKRESPQIKDSSKPVADSPFIELPKATSTNVPLDDALKEPPPPTIVLPKAKDKWESPRWDELKSIEKKASKDESTSQPEKTSEPKPPATENKKTPTDDPPKPPPMVPPSGPPSVPSNTHETEKPRASPDPFKEKLPNEREAPIRG